MPIKIKSDGIWRSSDTTNPTSSQPPLCPCCDVPLQDHQHQCVAAGDQTTEEQHESASDQCLDENLLNLKTCRDVVKNESLSSSEKLKTIPSSTRYVFISSIIQNEFKKRPFTSKFNILTPV